MMRVYELIAELEKVEDKNKIVSARASSIVPDAPVIIGTVSYRQDPDRESPYEIFMEVYES